MAPYHHPNLHGLSMKADDEDPPGVLRLYEVEDLWELAMCS